ncbi:MAG: hypothetical protein ACM3JI_04170, partial [Anaerolineae bacterium]
KESKIGQKSFKNRRTLSYARGLMNKISQKRAKPPHFDILISKTLHNAFILNDLSLFSWVRFNWKHYRLLA